MAAEHLVSYCSEAESQRISSNNKQERLLINIFSLSGKSTAAHCVSTYVCRQQIDTCSRHHLLVGSAEGAAGSASRPAAARRRRAGRRCASETRGLARIGSSLSLFRSRWRPGAKTTSHGAAECPFHFPQMQSRFLFLNKHLGGDLRRRGRAAVPQCLLIFCLDV